MGAVLYEVLTGSPPYDGHDAIDVIRKAQLMAFEPPERRCPDHPPPRGLCRVVAKAMAEDPEARYQTIEAMAGDLRAFLRGAWRFEEQRYLPGQMIVQEGRPGRCAYIITEGTCEVFRLVHGKKQVLRHLGAGEVFGETAVFLAQGRSASVAAIDTVVLMVVDGESMERELGMESESDVYDDMWCMNNFAGSFKGGASIDKRR